MLIMGNANNEWRAMSDSAIIGTIGDFIKHKRLQENKSQAQLAKEAGLNRWTLGQIENGESINLTSLIQLLRILDLLHLLEVFMVEESIGPIEYARMQEKKRKRARKKDSETNINEDLGW
jgi:transcriptional regulator with XRE-family HTH domain